MLRAIFPMRNFSRRFSVGLKIGIAILLTGCGAVARSNAGYLAAYQGPPKSDEELATIELGCCVQYIRQVSGQAGDGPTNTVYSPATRREEYHRGVKMEPGKYEISYRYRQCKTTGASYTDRLDLKPGHVYEVNHNSCSALGFFCNHMPSSSSFVWIEDAKTGEVISGRKPGVGPDQVFVPWASSATRDIPCG